MRCKLALTAVLLLNACALESDGPPRDCAVAKAEFWDCFDEFQSAGFEAMWYGCVPHSEPKIFEGSFGTDFEWSQFFENRQPSPEEAFPEDYSPPNLAFKQGVVPPASSRGNARLWAIRFVGREETCRLFPEIPPTFFVEKILDKELIWEVKGYPTYSFE
ncbi:hypothetical protein [Qipengyuania sp. JC766]|uniref:hypothetical protein n=1 Tax=Qipengyuania sp. JC766 TaxID=3232139 RepID=UPI00345996D9